MHISLPIDALEKAPPVRTKFAVLADLEAVLPHSEWDVHGIPGVLLGVEGTFEPAGDDDVFLDGLLHGSSATPVGYFAMTLAGHSFYVMFNPLDPEMRGALEQQNDANWLCVAIVAQDMQVARCATRVPVHRVALQETKHRAPVNTMDWLRAAERSAVLMPTLCAIGQPALAHSSTHQVYFLVTSQAEILKHIKAGGEA